MATNVYYSVSPFGTGDIKVAGNISIAGGAGAATFSAAQTGNIGIGCHVISSNIDGYISEMTDPTHATIVTALGAAHGDQALEALTSIAHEYASLSAFEAGFVDVNHVNNTDLTAVDIVACACFYYDHDDSTGDSTKVSWNFGVTDATRYVEVLVPNGGTQSINNQRPVAGIFDSSKALMELTDTSAMQFEESNARVTGLQISLTNAATNFSALDFQPGSSSGTVDFRVTDCIIHANGGRGVGIYGGSIQGGTITIINCIIYSMLISSSATGIICADSDWTMNIYNTTISDCYRGISQSTGTVVVKNSAIFNNVNDFNGTISCDYCASDDADATTYTNGINWGSEATDWNANFTNYAGKDFSVKDANADIYNAGTDLSGSGVTDDIIGTARPQATTYDIGAFEFIVAAAAGNPWNYYAQQM